MDTDTQPTGIRKVTAALASRTGRAFAIGVIVGYLGKHALALLPAACGTLHIDKVDWDGRKPIVATPIAAPLATTHAPE